MTSPWNKPKLIEMALDERDRQDIDDIQALMNFCVMRFKGPRVAVPSLFTVLCMSVAELYMRGEMNDHGLKEHAEMLRKCVLKLVKGIRKQSK
jgi:hypothetical protein